jgi:iron(III) transport system ATP-binding protein
VPALHCESIAKSYGIDPVLEDVDLDVEDGTVTAILGPSGSGKTTLLRIVAGFVAADSGTVRIGETTVVADNVNLPPEKRAVGYVAQEGALFPHISVAENIAFGLSRAERRGDARVAEMLDLVGLDASFGSRRPYELSGGEQRRVALARALAPRPKLVLLDEPFSGLDPNRRAETRAAVLRALNAAGATAVLVTHDQGEALSMGTQVAVLRRGRLVQTAAPRTLYRTPVDAEVARFVGEAVLLAGEVRDGKVHCGLGVLAVAGSPDDGPVEVMVRPEQIRLERDPRRNGDTPGAILAEVVGLTYFGPDALVQVELAGEGKRLLARTFDLDTPALGEQVELVVDTPVIVYPGNER